MVDTKATLLQTLGESISDISGKTANKKQDPEASESGVFLFFSFDLAESTVFKAEYPSLWSCVFTSFYGQVLKNLGVEDYRTPDNGDDDSACVRKLWKFIGDEILIYVRIMKPEQLYAQIKSIDNVLCSIMEKIADEAEEMTEQDHEAEHRRNVREVVLSSLGIKATAWLAECYDGVKKGVSNIVYCPTTVASGEKRTDFLGKEIDEGFRIAKYAVKNKIILSPLLAWMIWKNAQEDDDEKKVIESNFRITAFAEMKGVWRGRKVPLTMFHRNFTGFEDELEYDETDLATYANVKEAGFDGFKTDRRFGIDRIDGILKNVHKQAEAEALYEKLKDMRDIEMVSDNIERWQEFHVACLIFDGENRILVHKDSERGLEFGCIKKIFGTGTKNWKEICEKGYREKYNIGIDVKECPVPVATYYYEKSNAFGLIVMADYADTPEKISQREDWAIYSPEELMKDKEKAVDHFRENVKKAVELRKLQGIFCPAAL